MFLDSSAVELVTVNHLVGGSNPSQGAKYNALIAQLVEHLPCKQGVWGSNPHGGTIHKYT